MLILLSILSPRILCVSYNFSIHSNKQLSLLDNELVVSCPMGTIMVCKHVYKDCAVRLENHDLLADLVPLQIHDFDVILGMDWLSRHHASVDCYKKLVEFDLLGDSKISF